MFAVTLMRAEGDVHIFLAHIVSTRPSEGTCLCIAYPTNIVGLGIVASHGTGSYSSNRSSVGTLISPGVN